MNNHIELDRMWVEGMSKRVRQEVERWKVAQGRIAA